ncbi:hypothetical protein [Roseibacillus ishigakijimensis]|uniref:Uncharacterized protein n=1 Tax=Roseibacillus ishigakijimensis TaxID=454146 RepID=A0A934RX24_9BACT|nr:hypothetical protein [Roseibacillus ishigakijimensis]MBK1835725.1 hypothetical protein [Roseibacillus ishigakijimensis]
MKRFAIVAAMIALISGILLKGTFGHWIIVIAAGMYLGVPLAMFMAFWLAISLKHTGGIPNGLRATFLISLITGGSLLLSLGTGTVIHYWEIREARAFVAEMIPMLEDYRQKHGEYPKDLATLTASTPPNLLQDSHSYLAEADYFRFEYRDAAGMMDGYYFDSSSREWTYFD